MVDPVRDCDAVSEEGVRGAARGGHEVQHRPETCQGDTFEQVEPDDYAMPVPTMPRKARVRRPMKEERDALT